MALAETVWRLVLISNLIHLIEMCAVVKKIIRTF